MCGLHTGGVESVINDEFGLGAVAKEKKIIIIICALLQCYSGHCHCLLSYLVY